MLARPVQATSRRLVLTLAPLLFLVVSCEKVPLLAPTGSTISLNIPTNVVTANGSVDIVAQVLESGGTPPHSGTEVIFTTTLGTIQPSTAKTDPSGRATTKFFAGTSNGSATIGASSGAASTGTTGVVKLSVGTAAVGRVNVGAIPASVPAFGGSTTITANVLDINGNPLPSAPVIFSTTAGTLSTSVVLTDGNGNASTTLTTSQQAVVTASVGAQGSTTPPSTGGGGTTTPPATGSGQASGSVTVTVTAAPTLVITPPATVSAGLPASFTFAVTNVANGAIARSVVVDWGDGRTQSLGAVSGNAVVSHVYFVAGSYTVTATMTDSTGNTTSVSTAVTVIPAPRPTVTINFSPIPPKVNTATTFTIQVTAPQGIGVTSTSIDFGDGTHADLGGATGVSVQHVYTAQGTYTVTVTVVDTTGQTTLGTTPISVGL